MRIFEGVPWGGASNACGVVNNGNFYRFAGYFFGKFRDKASVIK